MNYSYHEMHHIYEKVKEDLEINFPTEKTENITILQILELYKKADRNRKKDTKEKVSQIPYFNELVSIFGKDIAYKVITKTSLSDATSQKFFKKAIIIERCIKEKIPFLSTLKLRIIFMSSKIEDCIVYIYIDEKNYLVSNLKELMAKDTNAITKTTTDYYKNMNLESKIDILLDNPISKVLFLQFSQI